MSAFDHVAAALARDGEGLAALIDALPDMAGDIDAAVAMIAGMQGRLIVTGMGKSGHIGTKLAATFASTGTRANCPTSSAMPSAAPSR